MKRSRQSLGFVLCLMSAALWAVHASTPKAAEPAAEPAASATTEPVAEPAAIAPAPAADVVPAAAASEADDNAATEPDWEALVAEAALADLQAAEYAACEAEAAQHAAESTAADESEHVVAPAVEVEAPEHVFVPAATEADAEEHVFVPADEFAPEEDGVTLSGQVAEWAQREWDHARARIVEWSDRIAAELISAQLAQAAAHQPPAEAAATEAPGYAEFVATLEDMRLPEVASAQGPMSVATPTWDATDPGFRGCEPSPASEPGVAVGAVPVTPVAADNAAVARPTVEARAAVRPVLTAAARVLDQMGQSLVELSRQLDQAGASMTDDTADTEDADPELPPTVGRNTIPESVYGL